jgi:hypothetical protein
MKARSYPIVLSLACGLAAFARLQAAESATPPYSFVDANDPAFAEISRLGQRTIDQAGQALVVEVRHVLADNTAALALGKLHLKDYKLPAPIPGRPAVIELRRTSLRVRNPANAPDAADRAALERIQRQLEQGDPVDNLLVQRVTLPGMAPEWRVYRPLVTLKLCLDCHGRTETLAPGVAETLQVFFPADKAVDYRDNEWRGLFRVSIVEPARKP